MSLSDLEEFELIDGTWVKFPFELLRTLTPNDAVVLSFLVNHYTLEKDKGLDVKGWVRLTPKRIGRVFHFYGRRFILTILARLEQVGVLKRKNIGYPAKRWYQLSAVRFRELVSRTESVTTVEPNQSSPSDRISHHQKSENSGNGATVTIQIPNNGKVLENLYKKRPSNREPSPSALHSPATPAHLARGEVWKWMKEREGDDTYKKMATRFARAFEKHQKINYTSKPEKWHSTFRQMVKKGIAIEDLQQVVEWYSSVLEESESLASAYRSGIGTNLPEVCSGATFEKKWNSLQIAMAHRMRERGEEPSTYRRTASKPEKKKKQMKKAHGSSGLEW